MPELSGAWRGSIPCRGEGFVKVWVANYTVRVRREEGLRRCGLSKVQRDLIQVNKAIK